MFKPVLPLVQDKIAHIFWKAQHIAKVHHHQGHHHAEEEIAAGAHKHEGNKVPATSKTAEPVSIHLISQSSYTISRLIIKRQKFATKVYNTLAPSVDKHYPHPAFANYIFYFYFFI